MNSLQFTFDINAVLGSEGIAMPFEKIDSSSKAKLLEIWPFSEPFTEISSHSLFRLVTSENYAMSWALIPTSFEKIDVVTEMIYKKMLGEARTRGYIHLVRAWNIIPRINEIEDGKERYKTFCEGRRRAFDHFDFSSNDYPAASGVGSKCETSAFVFYSSKEKAIPVSNPVQMEPYFYPKQYGMVSPTFARANLHRHWAFISGTASIRDHESLFAGDLINQTRITVENLKILCEKISVQNNSAKIFDHCQWRAYLRHKNDLSVAAATLMELGIPSEKIIFLAADICREELLIEIEGVYHGI